MNASPRMRVDTNDDVDLLVDTLIKDPSKADDVKAALRRRISSPQVVDFRKVVRKTWPKVAEDDDIADLWDNVPV